MIESNLAQVQRDAVRVTSAALRDAKQADAFDVVASAMLLSIAAIVRRERGAAALDDLLAIAAEED